MVTAKLVTWCGSQPGTLGSGLPDSSGRLSHSPDLSKRMVRAFVDAGGRAEYHLLSPIGEDGHRLIETDEARALWTPIVARFLAARP